MLNTKNRKITETGKEIIRKRNQVKKDLKNGDPVVFKLKKLLGEKSEKIKNLINTLSVLDTRVIDLQKSFEELNSELIIVKQQNENLKKQNKNKGRK